jgi:hypothetical protein
LLHFLYEFVPNWLTALFSPTRESIWEHVKLIFWPYLVAVLMLNRGKPRGRRPWLMLLPILCAVMLWVGYVYHIRLGGTNMAVDIGIYLLLMLVGFWFPPQFSAEKAGNRGKIQAILGSIGVLFTFLFGVLLLLFTFWPPEGPLFADLSAAQSWLPRPC